MFIHEYLLITYCLPIQRCFTFILYVHTYNVTVSHLWKAHIYVIHTYIHTYTYRWSRWSLAWATPRSRLRQPSWQQTTILNGEVYVWSTYNLLCLSYEDTLMLWDYCICGTLAIVYHFLVMLQGCRLVVFSSGRPRHGSSWGERAPDTSPDSSSSCCCSS